MAILFRVGASLWDLLREKEAVRGSVSSAMEYQILRLSPHGLGVDDNKIYARDGRFSS